MYRRQIKRDSQRLSLFTVGASQRINPRGPYSGISAGWRLHRCARTASAEPRLCRAVANALPGLRIVRPVTHLPTCATETAGAGGLKIAETFPEGRGSPHGCGLRAVFCTDAALARPAACRDKSKAPRSGDFAGRSPGVQGAAATGRPLCAPCAIRDITQKTYRERHLPGNNTEQPFLRGETVANR